MNDAALEKMLDNVIDDDLDRDFLFQLLSQAKNTIERSEKPLYTHELDETQTRTPGDLYTTMKNVAADFREMIELVVGTTHYREIPYAQRVRYKDQPHVYYIDHGATTVAKLGICGVAGASETIRQYYFKKTPDPTPTTADADETTLLMPSEFAPLVVWKGADIYYTGTDAGVDDISHKLGQGAARQYENLLDAFRDYDHDLKLKAMDNRAGYEPSDPSLDDILPHM